MIDDDDFPDDDTKPDTPYQLTQQLSMTPQLQFLHDQAGFNGLAQAYFIGQ